MKQFRMAVVCTMAVLACGFVFAQSAGQITPAAKAKLTVQTKEAKVVDTQLTLDKAPNRGGTVTLRLPGAPQTFNYYGVLGDNNTYTIQQQALDRLVEMNPVNNALEPGLATSWKIEGNSVIFKLRDVKWSDGKPFTADDVIFTMNYFVQNKNALGNQVTVFMVDGKPFEWSKIDDRTVKVTMARPVGTLFTSLTFVLMTPKHKLESLINKDDMSSVNNPWTTNSDLTQIVGTGAFVLDKYIVDQRVVLKRNPYSWRVDSMGNSLPYADFLEFALVKDNEAAMLKFESGEITYPDGISAAQFPGLKEKELKGAPYVIFRTEPTKPTPSPMHIAFNFDSKDPVLQKIFRTKEFRMAVERALDRKKVIEQVYSGLAVLGGSPILPSNKAFYNPAIEKIRRVYDTKIAATLLSGMGLKDANADGWLDRSDGKPLEIVLTVGGTKEHVETAMLLSESLKKLGVKLEMQSVDDKLFGEKINSGTFDMCIRAFGNQPDPHLRLGIYQPTGNLYYWHISTKDADSKPVFAEMYPWEKELYDIFAQGAVEMDQAKRKALYDRHQAIYAEEIPIIFVCKGMNLYGASKNVGNFYQNPQGLIVYSPYTVFFKK